MGNDTQKLQDMHAKHARAQSDVQLKGMEQNVRRTCGFAETTCGEYKGMKQLKQEQTRPPDEAFTRRYAEKRQQCERYTEECKRRKADAFALLRERDRAGDPGFTFGFEKATGMSRGAHR
jgi:hypothetical protein